jgi:hypothetical protein
MAQNLFYKIASNVTDRMFQKGLTVTSYFGCKLLYEQNSTAAVYRRTRVLQDATSAGKYSVLLYCLTFSFSFLLLAH